MYSVHSMLASRGSRGVWQIIIDEHYVFTCTEIPLPNEQARLDILKIHAAPITKHGEIGELSILIIECYIHTMLFYS